MYARQTLPHKNRPWLLLMLVLLYMALTCYALGRRSLWGDETYSVWVGLYQYPSFERLVAQGEKRNPKDSDTEVTVGLIQVKAEASVLP